MTGKHPSSQSFTVQYSGKVSQLVLDVGISDAFDPSTGAPAPPIRIFKSIWDTGATNSVISNKVVNALGIKPTGLVTAHTVNFQGPVPTYLVNIYLPNKAGFTGVRVTEGSLLGGEDVLIGMNIIGMGDFSVTNTNNQTCMSFRLPSLKRIDYVEESKRIAPQRVTLSPDEHRKQRNKLERERQGR